MPYYFEHQQILSVKCFDTGGIESQMDSGQIVVQWLPPRHCGKLWALVHYMKHLYQSGRSNSGCRCNLATLKHQYFVNIMPSPPIVWHKYWVIIHVGNNTGFTVCIVIFTTCILPRFWTCFASGLLTRCSLTFCGGTSVTSWKLVRRPHISSDKAAWMCNW